MFCVFDVIFYTFFVYPLTVCCNYSWFYYFCLLVFILTYLSGRCIRSDQSLSRVGLFVTPWIAACQASLSITNSQSSLRLTSIESVMPSSHLILCRPLLLLPPIPPSIRVLSNESTLHMRWPKYWSFSFSIIASKETPGRCIAFPIYLPLPVGLFCSYNFLFHLVAFSFLLKDELLTLLLRWV